jgi:hypothetical protein
MGICHRNAQLPRLLLCVDNGHGCFLWLLLLTMCLLPVYVQITFPPPTGDWSGISLVNLPGQGTYPISGLAFYLVDAVQPASETSHPLLSLFDVHMHLSAFRPAGLVSNVAIVPSSAVAQKP